jgi:PRC-barrel domain
MAAFDPATLERWRALAIVDRDGSTVGTISEFYLDRETGQPTWALVNTGLFGTSQSFVPLVHATEIADGLQVPYEKRHIKDSPRVDLHDELTPEEEAALFAHYGVDYQPATGDAAPGAPAVADADEPVPGEPPGPVAADPTSVVGGEGGATPVGATEALPVEHEPAEADGGHHHPDPDAETVTAGVPDEPGTADPDETRRTDREGVDPEGADWVEVGSRVEGPDGPADPNRLQDASADPNRDRLQVVPTNPDSDRDRLQDIPADPDPDRDQLHEAPVDLGSDQLRESPPDPDLGRTAPVVPGLPGSTAASPYGATATVDKGATPSGHSADESLQAPGEPGWAPGAAGSFEEHEPVDPPAGASDRWREAKLAAERDRIARAAAAQPEERSPLERARRRLERLVGVGQEPADHDEISPADREAAERARRARLGLDEEDQPRR